MPAVVTPGRPERRPVPASVPPGLPGRRVVVTPPRPQLDHPSQPSRLLPSQRSERRPVPAVVPPGLPGRRVVTPPRPQFDRPSQASRLLPSEGGREDGSRSTRSRSGKRHRRMPALLSSQPLLDAIGTDDLLAAAAELTQNQIHHPDQDREHRRARKSSVPVPIDVAVAIVLMVVGLCWAQPK